MRIVIETRTKAGIYANWAMRKSNSQVPIFRIE